MTNFEITVNKIMSMRNAYFFQANFRSVDSAMQTLKLLSFITVDSEGYGNKSKGIHLAIAKISDGAALVVGGRLSPDQALETFDIMRSNSIKETLMVVPPNNDSGLQGRLSEEEGKPGEDKTKQRVQRYEQRKEKNARSRTNIVRKKSDDGMKHDLFLNASIGIETVGQAFTVILERGLRLPCQKSQLFSTAADNQSFLGIHVLQGEADLVSDAGMRDLGQFTLKDIPLAPAGAAQIKVAFIVTNDGKLILTAKDVVTGHEIKVVKNDAATPMAMPDVAGHLEVIPRKKSASSIGEAVSAGIFGGGWLQGWLPTIWLVAE